MRYFILTAAFVPCVLATPEASFTYFPLYNTVSEKSEIKCLATMVYGEARGESEAGKVAVAYSALNRAKGKKSLCDVVLAPKQYSIFNNNPELRAAAQSLELEPRQANKVEEKAWDRATKVAAKVFRREVPDPTNGSTHYLAPVAMASLGYTYPKWSYQYKKVAVIDNHVFYKPYYPKKKKAND